MNKFTLSILLLFISYFASAQTGYKQKLTDYSSVVFPGQPVHIDASGHNGYRYIDSLAIYLAAIKDKKEDAVLGAAEIPEYYDGVVEGVLKGSNGKLISKKEFEIEGLKGVDFAYTSSENPNLPDLKFQRIIFINNALIVINLLAHSENKAEAEIASNKFFNSFVIDASGTELSQGAENPSAVKLGSLIGKLAAWSLTFGVLIGGVFLVVFIVRKFTVKSKSSKHKWK